MSRPLFDPPQLVGLSRRASDSAVPSPTAANSTSVQLLPRKRLRPANEFAADLKAAHAAIPSADLGFAKRLDGIVDALGAVTAALIELRTAVADKGDFIQLDAQLKGIAKAHEVLGRTSQGFKTILRGGRKGCS